MITLALPYYYTDVGWSDLEWHTLPKVLLILDPIPIRFYYIGFSHICSRFIQYLQRNLRLIFKYLVALLGPHQLPYSILVLQATFSSVHENGITCPCRYFDLPAA